MKRLGFGKKKDKAPRVNPNLLAFPEHVIYAAVGHHKPPAPDESMEKRRREMMVSALGYMPGEELDEEGNVINDSDEDETEEISFTGTNETHGPSMRWTAPYGSRRLTWREVRSASLLWSPTGGVTGAARHSSWSPTPAEDSRPKVRRS